jgi:hypothetical protein
MVEHGQTGSAARYFGGLAFRRRFRQTRGVVGEPDPSGHAAEAGEQMHSELDAIQERLRSLKRRLEARQSVYAIEGEIASGDAVEMNPLTAGESPQPPPAA